MYYPRVVTRPMLCVTLDGIQDPKYEKDMLVALTPSIWEDDISLLSRDPMDSVTPLPRVLVFYRGI